MGLLTSTIRPRGTLSTSDERSTSPSCVPSVSLPLEGSLTSVLPQMSAIDFEEAVHKLMKLHINEGQESEMCNMIIECCSQERSYSKFYGLVRPLPPSSRLPR